MKKKSPLPTLSKRAHQHEKLLRGAMSHPGVRELMEMYNDWRAKDVQVNQYRTVVPIKRITFSDNTESYQDSTGTPSKFPHSDHDPA